MATRPLTRSDFGRAWDADSTGVIRLVTAVAGRRYALTADSTYDAYTAGLLDGPEIVREADGGHNPDTYAGLWIRRAYLSDGPWWTDVTDEDEDDE